MPFTLQIKSDLIYLKKHIRYRVKGFVYSIILNKGNVLPQNNIDLTETLYFSILLNFFFLLLSKPENSSTF